MYTAVWWGNLNEIDHFEYLGLDGRTLNWMLKKLNGWIDVAQD
jgi:hypothetical protein